MTEARLTALARFVVETTDSDLDEPLRVKGAVSLLDATSAALRGRDEDTALRLRELLVQDEEGTSAVWGTRLRAPAHVATQVNGTATHAHFHDDTDMSAWAHPGSLIVPACLAVGERERAPLSSVIRAIICGYAVLHWLGADGAVAGSAVHRGLRASAYLGPLAAAAGVSNLLGLDVASAGSAIAIAADLAGGTVDPVRSGHASWRLQNGWAGHLGVLAADLAARGQIASPSALAPGWLRVATGDDGVPSRWATPPRLNDVHRVWQKHSPTLGDNIAAAACALSLSPHVSSRDVRSVTVRIARDFADYPGTSFRGPFERVDQALASTSFAVATALIHGSLDYDLQARQLSSSEVMSLLGKIEVHGVDDFDYLDAEVVVHAERTLECHSRDLPRGRFHFGLATAMERFASAAAGSDLPDPKSVLQTIGAWTTDARTQPSADAIHAALTPKELPRNPRRSS